jgi:hypothetical protein
MPQDSVFYIVNLIIGAILAGLMTQHWRLESGGLSLRYWILAAWTLTVADLFFVIRPLLGDWFRYLPTLMVTAGHATLWLAAQRTAERPTHPRIATAIVVAHAAALIGFLIVAPDTNWRTVTNGIVWGGLSIAAAVELRRGPANLRWPMLVPTIVLAAQGAFHAVRTFLATRVVVTPNADGNALVQLLGDLEVSLFMVALFVSVLVAYLRRSNADLRAAMKDVKQLAGLLPLCAWCKKVRDDDGYWTQLEQYLEEHRIHVTHGICESCEAKLLASKEAASG